MSLKKYKNKCQLIEDDIDKLDILPHHQCNGRWWWFLYDYEDYGDYDNYYDDWEYYDWEYVELPKLTYKILGNRRYGCSFLEERNYHIGSYIDMETVYGKIEMRNRKIDIVLGLREPHYNKSVTLGDFFDRIDKNFN
jgi:hypothetical protein